MSDVLFSHKNCLNFTPPFPFRNSCDVGPKIVLRVPWSNPAFSNNLPALVKFSNSVNVLAPALSFPTPNVARPTGSKKICASISITPVILLYAVVPGSIISSIGLNK